MAKYNYDKSVLKGLTTKDFMNQVKVRQSHIDAGSTDVPESVFGPNRLADEIHPEYIEGRILKKITLPAGDIFIIGPAKEKGINELPPFRAGQHITVLLDIPGKCTRRNYCITSPSSAAKGEHGFYQIVVSDHGPGHASEFINNTWQEGDIIRFSAPAGEVYYDPIRDSHEVLAIGVGGPSMALCANIVEGAVDIDLLAMVIIPEVELLGLADLYKEMEEKTNGKISYIPVLLNGEAEGVEKGPVTSDLLRKVMTDKETGEMKDMTILLTCPEPICSMIEAELKKLGVPKRRIRKELQGNLASVFAMSSYPAEKVVKQYSIKVWTRGECRVINCPSDKTLAEAVEDAEIRMKTSCRSGSCGMCHSRLISGEYYMPESMDGRREADRKFGWIHPCCTYPLSDMEIEVFPEG